MSNKLKAKPEAKTNLISIEKIVDFHNAAQVLLSTITGTKRTVFQVRVQRVFDAAVPIVKNYIKEDEKIRENHASIDEETKMYIKKIIGKDQAGRDVENYVFTKDKEQEMAGKREALRMKEVAIEPEYIPDIKYLPETLNNLQIKLLQGFVLSEDQVNSILYTESE